jgi:hypothetical protein
MELTSFSPDIKLIYSFNFAQDTTRELNYLKSEEVQSFLRKAIKIVKKSNIGIYEQPYIKKINNVTKE